MNELNQDNNYISDEEWNNPKPLSDEELAIHNANVAKLAKIVISYLIAKIGIIALIIVVLWKYF